MVLRKILENKEIFKGILREFDEQASVLWLRRATQPWHVVCWCDYGKHRSVGTGTLLEIILPTMGYHCTGDIIHESRCRWGEWMCGRQPCAICDAAVQPSICNAALRINQEPR